MLRKADGDFIWDQRCRFLPYVCKTRARFSCALAIRLVGSFAFKSDKSEVTIGGLVEQALWLPGSTKRIESRPQGLSKDWNDSQTYYQSAGRATDPSILLPACSRSIPLRASAPGTFYGLDAVTGSSLRKSIPKQSEPAEIRGTAHRYGDWPRNDEPHRNSGICRILSLRTRWQGRQER